MRLLRGYPCFILTRKSSFLVGVLNFWERQVEKDRAKMRRRPYFPGLKKEFPQFVPEALEYILYTLFNDQFVPFIPKIENCTFRLISHCSLYF